jgi:hypothetical protein
MWLAHPMFRCDDWNDLWFAARHGKVSGNHKPTKLVIFGFPKTWGPQFFIEILTHIFTIWPNCQTDDFLLGATVLRHSHILMITLLSRIVKTITAERIGSRRFPLKPSATLGQLAVPYRLPERLSSPVGFSAGVAGIGRVIRGNRFETAFFFCIASITTGNSQFREKMVKTTTKDWC